jgi:D-sedoheptulose 7-phosphate isomerase
MLSRITTYFGAVPGGVDLRRALADLPLDGLARFAEALGARRGRGRAIFLGNGGSYDNARLMASRCRAHGVAAKVPGDPDDYLAVAQTRGYTAIYTNGLEQDRVGPDDMVIGISGSGNSPNVVEALKLARARGAEAWCMGGRDGGAMRPVCGDERSLIGRNQCMEAIEDLHLAMLVIALEAEQVGGGVEAAHRRYLQRMDEFMVPANLARAAALADGLLACALRGGHAYVLGTGIGASHIRADLGRGATNAIPVRGIAAPEFFSMNSAQATANDDGLDFVLVDGLVKFDPGREDFAVLCELPGSEAAIAHCRELLTEAGTPSVSVGPSGIDLSAFTAYDQECGVAMLGHACGECIRAALHQEWRARRIDHAPRFPAGQKKLGIAGTTALEAELRRSGALAADEQVTFCYGALYAVRPPANRPARCYF